MLVRIGEEVHHAVPNTVVLEVVHHVSPIALHVCVLDGWGVLHAKRTCWVSEGPQSSLWMDVNAVCIHTCTYVE